MDNDLIQIGIEVRGRDSVRAATREIDGLGNSVNSARRSASAFVKAFEQQERQLMAVVRANQAAARSAQEFYRSLQQANLANKDAASSAEVFASRLDTLSRKYNPLYAASKQYETMLEEINEAHTLNVLSTAQFEVAQEQLTQQFATSTGAFARYNTAMMGSTKGLARYGVVMQQTGYQVGDFLVQVQSGTNAFVAFGQQATQLAGLLTMSMNPKLVALGAGLSIVIPLLTALAASFMRTRDSGEVGATAIERMASALDDLESLANPVAVSVSGALDNISEAARTTLSLFRDIAQEQLNLAKTDFLSGMGIREALRELDDLVVQTFSAEAMSSVGRSMEQIRASMTENLTIMGLTVEEARQFDRIISSVSGTTRQEMAESFANIVQQLTDAELITDETRAIIEQMGTELGLVAQITDESADSAEGLRDALQDSASASIGLTQEVDTLRARLAEARGEQGAVLANTLAQMRAEAELRHERRVAAGESEENSRIQLVLDRRRINQIGKLTQAIEDETEANRDRAGSVGKVTEEVEKLSSELDGPLTSAIGGVSNAWADFLMRGFQDFSSFKDAVVNSFKSMIAQMIATAARNRIMISLGMAGGGGVAGTAANAGGLFGNLGGSGSFLGALGNASQIGPLAGTALGAGLSGLSTGFMSTMNAGFAGMSGAISGGLSVGGITGITTAIGAAIPVLAAVAVAVSFFRSKTKELDNGIRVTVDSMDSLVETFSIIEKKRFFGLSKSVRTNLGEADPQVADPIRDAVAEIQNGVIDMARSLNIGADAFKDFSYVLDISLKGLSEEEATAKIQEELFKIGDAMAELIPDLEQFSRGSETLGQTLSRLSTSLTTVNNTFRSLGFTLFDVSLAGADAASSLIDLFGGLEQFQQTTSFYFQNFYSSTEQLQAGAQNLAIVLNDLGIGVLPKTRQEFRALIDTLMSAGETAKAAEVMQLAPAFVNLMDIADQVQSEAQARANAIQQAAQESVRAAQDQYSNAVRSLREAISREENRIEDAAKAMVDALEDQLNAAEDRLSQQTDIVDTLRDALLGRRIGTAEDQTNQLREANQYLRSLVGQGRIEDEEALQRALGVVEKPSVDLFENFVDYQRSFGRTSNVIDDLLTEQEKTLTADQQAVEALEIQIANAEEWKNQQLEALNRQAEISQATFDNISSVRQATDNVQSAINNLNQANVEAQNAQINATNIASENQVTATQSVRDLLQEAFEEAFDINLSGDNIGTRTAPKLSSSQYPTQVTQAVGLANYLGTSEFGGGGYMIDRLEIASANQLKSMANALNILTSGKVGSDIIDEIMFKIADLTGEGVSVVASQAVKTAQFALGGMHSGGARIVGERGPELEVTGPSRIYSATQTKSLLSGDDETKEEIRELRRDMQQMHKESMMAYSKIVRFEKDQRDTLRTWDITGLPETRTS